jgi:hypothetical protein
VQQLITKANKGNQQTFDTLRTRMDSTAGVWERMGDTATHALESMLKGFHGPEALLVHEAQKRHCTALARELQGPNPTPLEQLLVSRIVLAASPLC